MKGSLEEIIRQWKLRVELLKVSIKVSESLDMRFIFL
jgi:hypothetical protein